MPSIGPKGSSASGSRGCSKVGENKGWEDLGGKNSWPVLLHRDAGSTTGPQNPPTEYDPVSESVALGARLGGLVILALHSLARLQQRVLMSSKLSGAFALWVPNLLTRWSHR